MFSIKIVLSSSEKKKLFFSPIFQTSENTPYLTCVCVCVSEIIRQKKIQNKKKISKKKHWWEEW